MRDWMSGVFVLGVIVFSATFAVELIKYTPDMKKGVEIHLKSQGLR